MASICPGDLNAFFFTGGGAESNETAIRMARLRTGRQKILYTFVILLCVLTCFRSRYRSYHGSTLGSLNLTGDPRRFGAEPSPPGFVKFCDPYPYNFEWGAASEEELTHRNLQYLHVQIQPKTTISSM